LSSKLAREALGEPHEGAPGYRVDFDLVDRREHQPEPAAALAELAVGPACQVEVAAVVDLGREKGGLNVCGDTDQPALAGGSVLDGVRHCFGDGEPQLLAGRPVEAQLIRDLADEGARDGGAHRIGSQPELTLDHRFVHMAANPTGRRGWRVGRGTETEYSQARVAVGRLLDQVDIPEENLRRHRTPARRLRPVGDWDAEASGYRGSHRRAKLDLTAALPKVPTPSCTVDHLEAGPTFPE